MKKKTPEEIEAEKEAERLRSKKLRENLGKLMKGTVFDVPKPGDRK